ncbi:MAG: PEGA domain-containing protein [Oscillospiraceae bacterium]|nr:PEGA domain-containing protein [Oscillospiraceae bacterium]
MENLKSPLKLLLCLVVLCLCATGCKDTKVQKVPTKDTYTYVNPDETKAEPDSGFVIDGVLDEAAYRNNNWLYLSNQEGGADAQIAMTSYFGEKGMYFAYDVTENKPIYVNLDRPSYLNSCVEMYLAPSTVNNMKGNSVFEIDLLPTGHLSFKKSNGKGGFVDVASTADIMAYLGTTTKGGELNTPECKGYCLELFIPWEYMDRFDLNADAMKESFVYAGPAHITSFNYAGTDMDVDRYWYSFVQQHGASYSNVYQYFRFDKNGVQGTVPVEFQTGDNYTITGPDAVIPGMQMHVTVTPDAGYALKSITINGEEYIQKANFQEDGSVTITERGVAGGVKISAVAEAVTDGNKTLTGSVIAHKLGGGDLKNVVASYKGPTGEKPLELDAKGNFTLENLKQGYYTILLEKEGYQKLTRSIYVNRDMHTELSLEYDLFAATAYGWVLDEQNSGVLYKFGGSGELLTNDSYQSFTATAIFHFNSVLEQSGTTDSFTQQRQGFKFAFSNGKIWHIDLLKEDGKYYVQYAKHSGDNSMTGWKKIYTLNVGEATKFAGEEGLTLSVKREGRFANVYLDGKVIATEILDNAYASATVQIGFEAWAANREITQIPFNITRGAGLEWYQKFTVEATYKFSKSLEKSGTADGYTEQRQGLKILFNNGKIWHIDLLKQDGKYVVQYAKHSGDNSMTGWKKIYTLTDAEIANYTGKKGVTLCVKRDGKYANVYLDGKLIALEILDDSFASATAQIAPESWVANADTKTIPLEIKNSTDVDLKNLFFLMKDGWDVGGQYTGSVAMPEGGTGRLTFMEDQSNMRLSVIARDYLNSKDAADVYPRTDILFVFENGKQMSFGIDGKSARVQSMYDDSAADKYINTGWKTWGNLTDAEATALRSNGVKFTVVRYGTEVTMYVGDRMVAVADLTQNNSGVTAKTKATVSIRHYDDTGVRVEIPFELEKTFNTVKLSLGDNLVANKTQYFVGDTIKIQTKDAHKYITGLNVNGKAVAADPDGTYSFVATEKAYTITGQVAKTLFKPDSQWNLLQQNDGVISIPERTGEYASLYTVDADYRDAGITIKDAAPTFTADGNGNFQMQIRFIFANGKQYQVRLHNTDKDGKYKIQSMGGTDCITGWKWHADLTDAQTQKLLSGGIQFRVILMDDQARFYLDGKSVGSYSLKDALANNGLSAEDMARIHFMMYGNNQQTNLVIPYVLTDGTEITTIQMDKTTINGVVQVDKLLCTAGETVTITATPDSGYTLKSLTVKKDGQTVDIGAVSPEGGQYSFVAQKGNYTVQAVFAAKVQWTLTDGIGGGAYSVEEGKDYVTLSTTESIYREASVIVKDHDPSFNASGNGNFQMQIRFVFANGKQYQVRLHNTDKDGKYKIQSMGGTNCITGWKWLKDLSAAQTQALQTGDGVQFRVVLVGANAELYLDGEKIATVDLSSGGIKGNSLAQIRFVMYGNTNASDLEIPCAVGGSVLPIFTFANDTDKKNWDLAQQYENLLTITGKTKATGGYARILTAANTYRDVAVTVRDQQSGVFKMQIYFTFANGKQFQIRLDNEAGSYRVQNMSASIISSWKKVHGLTEDQVAKLQSEAGIKFRIQISGTNALVYLDDTQVGTLDLSAGIQANATAQITMIMYGNDGVEPITIPFELG